MNLIFALCVGKKLSDKLNFGEDENMNKRQSKKRYKKALELIKDSRKKGIGVSIINQISVDENGKPCDAMKRGSRLITLKHPQIRYIKSMNK